MHIEKYGIAQVKKLYQHYLREHITENVIQERTKENIILENNILTNYLSENKLERNSKNIDSYFSEFIKAKVKRKIRADSVVMCDLIITQPKEMGTECNQDFFDKCIDTFNKNYCKQNNIVSAVVHNDEQGQPHCHITFIPITEDGRLSAKDYIGIRPNKKGIEPIINLNTFHKDMERLTGYTLTSEDKTKKDLTMKEYQIKQEQIKKYDTILKQEEEMSKLDATIENNDRKIEGMKEHITEQEQELINKNNALKLDIEKNEIKLKEIQKEVKVFETDMIKDIDKDYKRTFSFSLPQPIKKLIQDKNEITFKKEDYNFLQQQINEIIEKLNLYINNSVSITKKMKREAQKEIEKEKDKIEEEQSKTEFIKNYELYKNDKSIEQRYKNKIKELSETIEKQTEKIDKLENNNKWLNKLIYNLEQFVLNRSDFTQKQLDYVEEHGKLPTQNRSQGLSM